MKTEMRKYLKRNDQYFFDVCQDLIVRTDFGHSTPEDHKVVVDTQCKKLRAGKNCHRRGRCIEMREM